MRICNFKIDIIHMYMEPYVFLLSFDHGIRALKEFVSKLDLHQTLLALQFQEFVKSIEKKCTMKK